MIDNCCFMLMRHCPASVFTGGLRSLQTCVTRSSKYKIVVKNPKSLPKKTVVVWRGMQIKDLAVSLNMNVSNVMDTICRVIGVKEKMSSTMELNDLSLMRDVAKLCGRIVDVKNREESEAIVDKDVYCRNIYLNSDRLKSRPPIVTIMGHVDHGKTTLLDSLRSSRIVDSEFGGITQHIGAFKVKLSDIVSNGAEKSENEIVTFLDTPGHAAFSLMRSRGVRCTDIVVLVVSVDDGLMPQTLESIRYAKEAKVPMIVVMNKVDRLVKTIEELRHQKATTMFDNIRRSLSKYGVVVEEFGGDVQCIPISALKKWNLDLLQESILALSEIMSIKCDYEGLCEGVILETKIADHHGKVATILLQQGTLKVGSYLVAGYSFAKVRTMVSDVGKTIREAVPGDPIEVSGWKDLLPSAGDIVIEVESENRAKEVLNYRKSASDKENAEKAYIEYNKKMEAYKESYRAYINEGFKRGFRLWKDRPVLSDFDSSCVSVDGVEIPQVNVIIKTDVDGSLEAIQNILSVAMECCSEQCCMKIAHIGVGNLTDSDVRLATFTNSVVYLFNLPQSMSIDASMAVDVRHFNVIYHLFDDLRDLITSKLPTLIQQEIVGEATVLQMFEMSENRAKIPVIGCKCVSGLLYKDKSQYLYRVMRKTSVDSSQLEGEIVKDRLYSKSLRHLRNDVDSIRKGVECGLILADSFGESYKFEVDDVIQCYKEVKIAQKLNWNLGFQ